MWTTETPADYQSTQEKASTSSKVSQRANANLPLWWSSFGGMSIPNVSIDHQGFAGTITHMDGMIRKRRQERNIEFMFVRHR